MREDWDQFRNANGMRRLLRYHKSHRSNIKDLCSKSNVRSPKPFSFNVSNTFDTTKFTFNVLGLRFIGKKVISGLFEYYVIIIALISPIYNMAPAFPVFVT